MKQFTTKAPVNKTPNPDNRVNNSKTGNIPGAKIEIFDISVQNFGISNSTHESKPQH